MPERRRQEVTDAATSHREREDKEERCEIIHCGGGSCPATSWNVVAPGKKGTRSSAVIKLTAAGDLTMLLGYVAKKS